MAEEATPEAPRSSTPLSRVAWTILSFLNPNGALINPLIGATAGSSQVKETTRVEREAPIEDAETFPDSNTTGIMETSNFVDFYKRLQAIRHQMSLDSNQTLTLDAMLDDNSTQTLEFVLHVLPLAPQIFRGSLQKNIPQF